MKTSTLVIIVIVIWITLLTWLVSIWQYDTMKSSMMIFYHNPAALSLFVGLWTAGMAAMMFPAIVPMILVFNRHINTNNASRNNPGNSNTNGQMAYHRSINDGMRYPLEEGGDKSNFMHRLRNILQSKSPNIILFVLVYLGIWAATGVVLLVGWSLFFDILLPQIGQSGSQQQQLIPTNIIYGIVLIVAGTYQFSLVKTKCLGYCESPLTFLMRRPQKGRVGALKLGMYHGLYCLGCCWPYFLIMVTLGWMNFFWMGLIAAIIFAEKIWTRGGLWIGRLTGIGFIILGILSSTGAMSLPSDSMIGGSNSNSSNNNNDSSNSDDIEMMMSMDMSSSSSTDIDS